MKIVYKPEYFFWRGSLEMFKLELDILGKDFTGMYNIAVNSFNLLSYEWDTFSCFDDSFCIKNGTCTMILGGGIYFYYDKEFEGKMLEAIRKREIGVEKISWDEFLIREIVK